LGATGQLEDCRKLAADRGWSVGDEYVDNDVSAFSGNRRRDYERMLADLGSGARNAVIVYNLDRLHRRPAELEEFVTLCERAGADAAGAADPESDPAQTVSASDRARKSWLAAESRRTDSRGYCPHWRRRPYYAASKTPTATPSCCVWPSMMPVNIGARVWPAWNHTGGRSGRWGALVGLGCVIRPPTSTPSRITVRPAATRAGRRASGTGIPALAVSAAVADYPMLADQLLPGGGPSTARVARPAARSARRILSRAKRNRQRGNRMAKRHKTDEQRPSSPHADRRPYQRLRRIREGSTSPDCTRASSMNRCTGRERKNPVWPPWYQWISGLPQCSQSRVTWSRGCTNRSAMPA